MRADPGVRTAYLGGAVTANMRVEAPLFSTTLFAVYFGVLMWVGLVLRRVLPGIPGFDALEITTCLRRGEVEVVTRYEPDGAGVYQQLMALMRQRHGAMIFSEDGSLVDDQVARLLAGAGPNASVWIRAGATPHAVKPDVLGLEDCGQIATRSTPGGVVGRFKCGTSYIKLVRYLDLIGFEGASSGLLGQEDYDQAGAALEPGASAAILLDRKSVV